jgi:hypothetical protein
MITFSRLGRYGQIGNQMFQIAGTMGIATRQNERYAFPEWHNYDGVDKGNMSAEDSHIEPWFTMPLPRITPTEASRCRHVSVPWGYHPRFRAPSNADLLGHMQSEKWFKHCERDVRDQFTWAIAPVAVNKCAIHVRGGDYDGVYHNRLTEKYYHDAMQIMHERGIGRFSVFSDDPVFAKAVTGMDSVNIPDAMNAMRMMSGYAAIITANSSFSWWSAWLSGSSNIIAPSQWVGQAAKLDTSDIIPETWMKVDP